MVGLAYQFRISRTLVAVRSYEASATNTEPGHTLLQRRCYNVLLPEPVGPSREISAADEDWLAFSMISGEFPFGRMPTGLFPPAHEVFGVLGWS